MRKMIASVVIVAVLAMASISHSQEPTTTPDLQKELARLRAENQQLKKENDLLRQRLARVATTRPYELRLPDNFRNFRDFGNRLRITPRMPSTTQPFNFVLPESGRIPNHWVPKQFNGETFYVIPLGAESRPTPVRASQR
jgi:hypothetical protein